MAACGGSPAPASTPLPQLEARVNAEPGDPDAALRLAMAYRDAGRLEDARVLLERATANLPRAGRLIALLGLTYEDLGRFADARRLYERYAEAPDGGLRRQVRARLPLLAQAEMRAAAREALSRESELSATPSPATVAVFPFHVQTADSTLRPLGRALAEMLSTDLAQTSRLTVLERARVQALLDEARLADAGLTEPGSAVRAGRLLSAGSVVQGRISGGETLRLDAVVAAAGSEGAGPAVSRQSSLDRILDEEKELALRIYASLGVELTPAEHERVTRRMTRNVQALLVFGAALEAQDLGEHARAAELFRRAGTMDAGFAAARVRAAQATEAARAATTAEVAALLVPIQPGLAALEPGDLAPIPLGREPTSEALGTEGFSRPRTTVEIIIIRP